MVQARHWTCGTQMRALESVCFNADGDGKILVFKWVGGRDAMQESSCAMKNYFAFHRAF